MATPCLVKLRSSIILLSLTTNEVSVTDTDVIILQNPRKSTFHFDRCVSINEKDREQSHCKNELNSIANMILLGFNSTLLLYNTSINRKSGFYSSEHEKNCFELKNIDDLLSNLFSQLGSQRDQLTSHNKSIEANFDVELRCYEVMDTQIRDLLIGESNGSKVNLKVREKTNKDVFVDGLTSVKVNSHHSAISTITEALQRRMWLAVGDSSVSAAGGPTTISTQTTNHQSPFLLGVVGNVFVQLAVTQTIFNAAQNITIKKDSRLEIVSIATAETLNYKPSVPNEAMVCLTASALPDFHTVLANNNSNSNSIGGGVSGGVESKSSVSGVLSSNLKSLAALTRVVQVLRSNTTSNDIPFAMSTPTTTTTSGVSTVGSSSTAKSNNTQKHVPYRDSLLTRLLQRSLHGNCFMSMITVVSDSTENLARTLRFASEIGGLYNRVSIQQHVLGDHMSSLAATTTSESQAGKQKIQSATISTTDLGDVSNDQTADDNEAGNAAEDGETEEVSAEDSFGQQFVAFRSLFDLLQNDIGSISGDLSALTADLFESSMQFAVKNSKQYRDNRVASAASSAVDNDNEIDGSDANAVMSHNEDADIGTLHSSQIASSADDTRLTSTLVNTRPTSAATDHSRQQRHSDPLLTRHPDSVSTNSSDNPADSASSANTASATLNSSSNNNSRVVAQKKPSATLAGPSSSTKLPAISKTPRRGSSVSQQNGISGPNSGSSNNKTAKAGIKHSSTTDSGQMPTTAGLPSSRSSTSLGVSSKQTAITGGNSSKVTTNVSNNGHERVIAKATLSLPAVVLGGSAGDSNRGSISQPIDVMTESRRTIIELNIFDQSTAATSSSESELGSLLEGEAGHLSADEMLGNVQDEGAARTTTALQKQSAAQDIATTPPVQLLTASDIKKVVYVNGQATLAPTVEPSIKNLKSTTPSSPLPLIGGSTPAVIGTASGNETNAVFTPRRVAASNSSSTGSGAGALKQKPLPFSLDSPTEKSTVESTPLSGKLSKSDQHFEDKYTLSSVVPQPPSSKAVGSFPAIVQNTMSADDGRSANRDVSGSLLMEGVSPKKVEKETKSSFVARRRRVSQETENDDNGGNDSDDVSEKEHRFLRHCAAGQVQEAEWCLTRLGVNVHVKNNFDRDAMQICARNGSVPMLTMLLRNGGALSSRGPKGDTLFHLAAYNGHVETLKFLLSAGIIAESVDKYGMTAVHLAAKRGEVAVLRYLYEEVHMDFTQLDFDGRLPIECIPYMNNGEVNGFDRCREFLESLVE